MRPTLSLLVLLVSLLVAAPLKASLEDIRHAQALLGPGTWSQLIRIENERPTATYPRKTFALVFEFNGILWFYTARDGTQSLSLFTGRVEKDRKNLHPLLLEIDSGNWPKNRLGCSGNTSQRRGLKWLAEGKTSRFCKMG